MILVALKGAGEVMTTRYTEDPFKKFKDVYGGSAVLTPVEGKETGLVAITHNQPDFDFGINLELYGTLIYGPLILVNVGGNGEFASLTHEQLDKLRRDAGLLMKGA